MIHPQQTDFLAALDAEIEVARSMLSGLERLRSEMSASMSTTVEREIPVRSATLPLPAAAERFSILPDTLRRLCRDKGMGEKHGRGRWEVNVTALQIYIASKRYRV